MRERCAVRAARSLTRLPGEVLGERVASSKLDMPDAKALNAKLIKRQYFGEAFSHEHECVQGVLTRPPGRMPSRLEPF